MYFYNAYETTPRIMKLRILSLLVLFFILVGFSLTYGQNMKNLEHIDKYFETEEIDEKIGHFYYGYVDLAYTHKDSVLYFVKELQRLGIEEKNRDAIAMASFGLAYYFRTKSMYDESENSYNKALNYYLGVENDTMTSIVYNLLGNVSYLRGELAKAESRYEKSTYYAKKVQDSEYEILPVSNLARIYIDRAEYDKAKESLERHIEMLRGRSGSLRDLASSYGILGELYLHKQDYELASENFIRSMEYGLAIGGQATVANAYTNLGITEYFTGNIERSEQYFKLALDYRILEGDKYYISEAYYNMGDLYFGLEMLDSAVINYERAIVAAEEVAALKLKVDALEQLGELYESTNEKDKLISILQEIIQVKDELSKRQIEDNTNLVRLNEEQSKNELLAMSNMREKELESKVGNIQSIFNNWVLLSLASLFFLLILFFFARRKKTHH